MAQGQGQQDDHPATPLAETIARLRQGFHSSSGPKLWSKGMNKPRIFRVSVNNQYLVKSWSGR